MKKQTIEIAKINNQWLAQFKKVPYHQRLLLISHCLRCIGKCKEIRQEKGLICQFCNKHCQICQILKEADRLGYKKIYILSGGSVIKSIIKKEKPAAIVAVACHKELLMGAVLVKQLRKKIHLAMPLQIIQLRQPRCEKGSKVAVEKTKKILGL